jgi:N-acetyl sugar amidotransferase
MDTSDPTISFDGDGVCSHCHHADRLLPTVRWTAVGSESAIQDVAEQIRNKSDGPYDSIIGLSGGVDSSYTAYLAKRLGLRPMAVHFDNGWNSELAVENIQRVVEGCEFDLRTVVIDWKEFRDLQRAFLLASVVDIEMITDHAISAAMARLADENNVRFVLSGFNIATEHGMPAAWFWDKGDWTNIRAIHEQFGVVPLRTFPHQARSRRLLARLLGREPVTVQLLNLVNYRRDEAAQTLTREFGWREYGGKHHESTFTRFYQSYILPTKFGIDKRRVHLSDRIRNGELSRSEALELVDEPLYRTPQDLAIERDFVLKKLGFTEAEFATIMSTPPRAHDDFQSDRRVLDLVRVALRPIRALRSIASRPAA